MVCRAVKELRFRTSKAIVEDVRQSEIYKNETRYIVWKILHKYKFFRKKRKRKPLVSNKNRKVRRQWVQAHNKWSIDSWKNVIFSDEYRFGFKLTQEL